MPTQEEIDRGDFIDEEEIEELEEELEKEDEVEEEKNEDEDSPDIDDDDEDDGEGEEEAEDTEEEESEEEGSEDDSENEGENRIPLSRLNRALAQRDEQKERTQWLEQQLEKLIEQGTLPAKEEEILDPFDFATAESKYVGLILEGDSEGAAALRTEIDSEKTILIKSEIDSVRDEAREFSKLELAQEKFDVAVSNFENKHTFLDSSSEEYNEEAVDTTNALMIGYVQNGLSKVAALKKAVERVAPMYGKTAVSKKTTNKAKEARKKNISAMKGTPPKTRGKTRKDRNLEDIKVSDLPDKDFNKLTSKEKAILRGDIVG